MQIVKKATLFPAKCLLTGDLDGPFLDTGLYSEGNRVYLHVPMAQQIGKAVGMTPAADDRITELEAQVAELEPKALAWDAIQGAREEIPA